MERGRGIWEEVEALPEVHVVICTTLTPMLA